MVPPGTAPLGGPPAGRPPAPPDEVGRPGNVITTSSPAARPEVICTIVPDVRPVVTVRVSSSPSLRTVTVDVPFAVVTARAGTWTASATSA